MTDHNARQAGLTDGEEMRQGYEEQRRSGINVDWFTWQIAWADAQNAILAAHSADARNGEGVALTQEMREHLQAGVVALSEFQRDNPWIANTRALLATAAAQAPGQLVVDGLTDEMVGRVLRSYIADICDEKIEGICHDLCLEAAILAAPATPAPKKDFLNGWREAIEQLPVSRESAPAPAAQADELAQQIATLYQGTTNDLVHRRMGVVVGGPFREFKNGSAQSQVAMFTGAEHFAEDERDRNASFYAGIHALIPQILAALTARQQSATPAEPFAWTTDDEREPITNALRSARMDLYGKSYTVPLYRATPADAASEADKRDAYAAGLQRAETICREQKYMALQPMRTFSAEDVLQANRQTAKHLADLIQYERQQGAQSNG